MICQRRSLNAKMLVFLFSENAAMGIVYAAIKLSNARDTTLRSVDVSCLVDTGATNLCIPEAIALQLKLEELQKRDVNSPTGI